MNWPGLHVPTACAFRFSQPLDAFIRPEPAGLIACRIRSWGHPPELSSSRAAVRRSRRLSPRDVLTVFRVLLCARVRHSVQRFRLKTERVALLGLFPSRVLTLSALSRPSPVLPSCSCLLGRARPNGLRFRVSHAESAACLSRDRRPSWGLWPLVVMPARASLGFWSRLRRRPGFVTAPWSALLRIPAQPYRSRTLDYLPLG
jgi:hypothetical protein